MRRSAFSGVDAITINYEWQFRGKEVAFMEIIVGDKKFRSSRNLPVYHNTQVPKEMIKIDFLRKGNI